MNCPNCQHDNANPARFCADCGTPLTQPMTATVPTPAAPAPASRRNRRAILLAVLVLLLFAIGIGAAFQLMTSKGTTPAASAGASTGRLADSRGTAAPLTQRAPADGAATGSALGTGVKGESDNAKAPEDATPHGQPIEPSEKTSGNTGALDAADGAHAATAVAGFLGALSSAVGGTHRHDPVDFHTLEGLLPASLPGMQPATPEGNADETMSIKTTSAHVDFSGPNDARIHLSIRDATAISGLAGLADMANPDSSQQGDSYDKTEALNGRSVHEKWDATARHGELSLSVGQRFAVDVVGDHVDMDALKNALARMDLGKLESMKDANPVTK